MSEFDYDVFGSEEIEEVPKKVEKPVKAVKEEVAKEVKKAEPKKVKTVKPKAPEPKEYEVFETEEEEPIKTAEKKNAKTDEDYDVFGGADESTAKDTGYYDVNDGGYQDAGGSGNRRPRATQAGEAAGLAAAAVAGAAISRSNKVPKAVKNAINPNYQNEKKKAEEQQFLNARKARQAKYEQRAAMAAKSAKKPFYKKWWFWVIIGLLVLGMAIGSCGEDVETETKPEAPSTTQGTVKFYETAETVDLKSGDGSNIIGKVSIAHAKKSEITDEALNEWFKNVVDSGDYNFCVIVYDDVNPTQGVFGNKYQVQKDIELIPDNGVYQVGSDEGSTFYKVKDDRTLEPFYSEPSEEEANAIISQIDSYVSSSFKGDGYLIEVAGDKNKLDAQITLVNSNMDNNTYQGATDYLAKRIKEGNLPIGYMNIAFQSDKYTIKALGSVDDVTAYTGPSDVSVKTMD